MYGRIRFPVCPASGSCAPCLAPGPPPPSSKPARTAESSRALPLLPASSSLCPTSEGPREHIEPTQASQIPSPGPRGPGAVTPVRLPVPRQPTWRGASGRGHLWGTCQFRRVESTTPGPTLRFLLPGLMSGAAGPGADASVPGCRRPARPRWLRRPPPCAACQSAAPLPSQRPRRTSAVEPPSVFASVPPETGHSPLS